MAMDNSKYDTYAPNYDNILLNWDAYIKLRDIHLKQMIGLESVLDVCAGTGNVSIELLEQSKQIIAIDRNEAMLAYMLEKKAKLDDNDKLRIFNMDAENLEFPDNFFDGVTAMNAIYNLSNPLKGISEAYRVLKTGGVFCMSGPLKKADSDFLADNILENMVKKGLDSPDVRAAIESMRQINAHLVSHATLYDLKEIKEILTGDIGFKRVIVKTDNAYLDNAYFIAVEK